MTSIEALAGIKPKENAGPRSSNRFEYQINWGLLKLLELEESKEDYVMILDYHDDIVICNSTKESDYIDFYQVKTRKGRQWGLSDINESSNKVDDQDANGSDEGLGILSKLINHTKIFEQTRNLYFVTNSSLSQTLFGRSDDIVYFDHLKDSAKDSIKKRVKSQLGEVADIEFEKLVFIQNQMSVGNYEATVLGILNKFITQKYNIVTNVYAVYDNLIGQLRKRNNYEKEVNTKEDLIKCKSITHEEFLRYLNTLTLQKSFDDIKKFILAKIENEVSFLLYDQVTDSLNDINCDMLNYDNEELSNLMSEIRIAIRETIITEDVKGLWDYSIMVYKKLMLTYNNYKQHSDMYLKSLILFIYAKDKQRTI